MATSNATAKSGYLNTYARGAAAGGIFSTYTINADPAVRGTTEQRSFFTDQTVVIRDAQAAATTAASLPIQ